jgi:protein gp37
MGKTSIEWTDRSVNPLRARLRSLDGDLQPIVNVGHYCEKLSPGCKNCYSSSFQPRFGMPQFQDQRGDKDIEHWLDVSKLQEVLRRRKPTKWFWCDMTDMFGSWVPIEHIALCFATMAATSWHTHQVLTKRPDRMRDVVRQLYANDGELLLDSADQNTGWLSACHIGQDEWTWPLPNVWLGTSAEDQPRLDKRVPALLETPAAVRFISAEPLLEGLQLDVLRVDDFASLNALTGETSYAGRGSQPGHTAQRYRRGLDWVIVGGESGAGARALNVAWLESIVDQCRTAGTAVFVKQLGAKPGFKPDGSLQSFHHEEGGLLIKRLNDRKGGDMSEWPESLRVREFPEAHA